MFSMTKMDDINLKKKKIAVPTYLRAQYKVTYHSYISYSTVVLYRDQQGLGFLAEKSHQEIR